MRGAAALYRALRHELAREWLRFTSLNSRSWLRAISGSISMALWLLAAIVAMSWYGIARIRVDRYIYWVFFTYTLYSEPIWAAAEARSSLKGGVAEQILAARGDLAGVMLAWLFVDSSIWSALDSAILLLVFAAIFGRLPELEQPLLLVAAVPPLLAFSILMGLAALYVMSRMENTWIAGLAFQLVVPALGGILPPTVLPRGIAQALLLSPLQYVIAPVIYAGTGVWPLDPSIILVIDYIITISSIAIVNKYKNYLYLFSR
jgi:ABC-2 type transport system permease protein